VTAILQRRRVLLPQRPRDLAPRVACVACGCADTAAEARLAGWQVSRDGCTLQCAACADLRLVELDDQVLYWPACGHGPGDDVVLYDRPVCVRCDDAARDR
jgi:hypothetical protein